jgi:hypothetical protein
LVWFLHSDSPFLGKRKLLLVYQGCERRVATFYDLPGIPHLKRTNVKYQITGDTFMSSVGATTGTLMWFIVLALWGTYSLLLYVRKTWATQTKDTIAHMPLFGAIFRHHQAYLILGIMFWLAALWQLFMVI